MGDTIAAVTQFFGLDKVADAVAKLAGAEGCGCKERQEYLNQLFPYDTYQRSFTVLKDLSIHDQRYRAGETVTVTKHHPLFSGVIIFVKDGYLQEI